MWGDCMSERVKIAVIGVGNMGSAHAHSIFSGKVNGLQLAALCDIREARKDYCAAAFPGIPFFESWESLLAASCAEAVLIAVPHRLHAMIACAALESGYHVLVEKPVDIRVSAALKLNETAQRSGRVFAVMLNQRTNALYARAREIVQGGELGELKRNSWIITNWYRTQSYYDSSDWRATWSGEGGGVLINQAPHNLDLWQWICGMPQSVVGFCDVGKYHRIEVEDEATIFARYANGATGTLIASTGEYPGTNRLEISGDRGKLVLENGQLKWWKLNRSEKEYRFGQSPGGEPETEYCEWAPAHPETAHLGILQNFTNAVLYGEELLSPGEDGIRELMISNAAYLSAWKGGVAVPVPFDTEEFDRMLEERIQHSKRKPDRGEQAGNTAYLSRWSVRW